MRPWPRHIRDGDLSVVMQALYDQEINCGIKSFWDAGWTVWIGIGHDWQDVKAEQEFGRDHFNDIPQWLVDNAERLYPALRDAYVLDDT